MAEFHFNEGAIEVPDAGVTDRSMTAIEISVGRGRPVSVAITRQPRGGLGLNELLRDSLKVLGVSLRRFKSGPPRFFEVQGFKAVDFEMTWVHDSGPMFHRLMIVELDEIALNITAAGTDGQKVAVEKVHKMAIGSLKIRRKR